MNDELKKEFISKSLWLLNQNMWRKLIVGLFDVLTGVLSIFLMAISGSNTTPLTFTWCSFIFIQLVSAGLVFHGARQMGKSTDITPGIDAMIDQIKKDMNHGA